MQSVPLGGGAVLSAMIMSMIVAAGPVMAMVVIMAMIMMAVVVMIVTMMIMAMVMMMAMIVAMVLALGGRRCGWAGIGATFGIERRLDLDKAAAEAPDHVGDDVVAPDAQSARRDLGRQMAVAEMPGDAHQMLGIRPPDLDQWFGGCDHFHQPAVFQHQGIATAQRHGLLEIEQEGEPTGALHGEASTVAVVETEHHRIGRLTGPPGAEYLHCADHSALLAAMHRPAVRRHRTSTLAGVITSIRGGAVRHFAATRPNARMCSLLP